MLRHECRALIQDIQPVFEAAGYDLRVGDQIGDAVHVFITDISSEIEDPKPVHINADAIRSRDIDAIAESLAARCPLRGSLWSDLDVQVATDQGTGTCKLS
jgi:hypothetical protein